MVTSTEKDAYLDEFATRLNEALDKIGFPRKGENRQGVLAEKMHVSQKGARKWLEGESIPQSHRLKQLAKLTNTTVAFLRGEESLVTSLSVSGDFYVVEDSTMEPNFPIGTKIYIDDNLKPQPGDYVIVASPLFAESVFRQYHETMGKKYLKPIGNFPVVEISSDMVILGVAVKAIIELKAQREEK